MVPATIATAFVVVRERASVVGGGLTEREAS